MEYAGILPYHNLTRWLVLAAASWALALSWRGWLRGGKWSRFDALAGLAFATALNVQLVIGVLLYLNSPYVKPVFAAPAYATSSLFAFFFTVAHPCAMILAVVTAQATYSLAKRAGDDRHKFRRAAVGYSLAMALILAAVPWPFLSYGRPLVPGFGFLTG